MTLGFLGFGLRQETDTQCNALALNKLGSRLLPCGDAASWLEFAGFLVVFGLLETGEHTATLWPSSGWAQDFCPVEKLDPDS